MSSNPGIKQKKGITKSDSKIYLCGLWNKQKHFSSQLMIFYLAGEELGRTKKRKSTVCKVQLSFMSKQWRKANKFICLSTVCQYYFETSVLVFFSVSSSLFCFHSTFE